FLDPAAEFREAMERHGPTRALPEEIRKMSRDETVCKYCGVSYLVLHEFKVMEEKVKAMEKEIKFYEGSIEREKGLQAELQSLYQGLEHYRADSESKTERIKNLTVELKNRQDELKNVKGDLRYFQEEKEAAYKQSQALRSELDSIKEVISSNLENWAAMKEEIFLQIKTVSKEALTAFSPRWRTRTVLRGSGVMPFGGAARGSGKAAPRGVGRLRLPTPPACWRPPRGASRAGATAGEPARAPRVAPTPSFRCRIRPSGIDIQLPLSAGPLGLKGARSGPGAEGNSLGPQPASCSNKGSLQGEGKLGASHNRWLVCEGRAQPSGWRSDLGAPI
ncbi:PREDICTED: uncharacterized protein LOC104354327, partial [Leptosomus discolor]|uniref:uncharacterized protein LOC104354327 n=1 Tax=Leptosomus discolor TaxID=188344 RepID=UPI0005228A7B